jgi:hypothetical protein
MCNDRSRYKTIMLDVRLLNVKWAVPYCVRQGEDTRLKDAGHARARQE